jgi:hypothetical protein
MGFIPLDQCEHGWLYYIKARFNGPKKEFIGIRTKFGSRYLFGEYHWDTGPPHGTVKPVAKLEQTPDGWLLADWPEGTPDYDADEYPHEAPGHS